MKNKNKKRVLIVAGGTAGHVFPAIEVANKFYKNGYNISFITDKRMFEFLRHEDVMCHVVVSSVVLIHVQC